MRTQDVGGDIHGTSNLQRRGDKIGQRQWEIGTMAVMTCRGIVKGNIVVLEDAAILPEGSEVEVRLLGSKPDLARRRAAGVKLRALGEKLKGRNINLSKYVIEAREELEERV